jgi:hypothetical protein
MDPHSILAVLSPILTIVVLIVGVAMWSGKFSTLIDMVKTEVDRLRETVTDNHAAQTSFREEVLVRFAEMGGVQKPPAQTGRVLVKRAKKTKKRRAR